MSQAAPQIPALDHALVIGASMGGLLAARALSEHFARVTVIERDEFPGDADAPRKGVPQGRHAHGLLAQGRVVLEQFFPGLSETVVARGGCVGDIMNDVAWHGHGVQLCQAASPLVGLLASRPLLEACVRERLLALPGVSALSGCSVRGLLAGEAGASVRGVRLVDADGVERELAADLVVDCSGRGSAGAQWLQALGWARPAEERIELGLGYTTRLYRRRPGDLGGKLAVVVAGHAPDWRNGALLYHAPDRWIISAGGYFGDHAPSDEAGFRSYLASLATPALHDIAAHGEPLSDFVSYRFPANLRRRYDRLPALPRGYLPFGDALCSFNPVYGQGMTVAAQESLLLLRELRAGLEGLAPRFLRAAFAGPIETAWSIAAGNDLRHPRVQAPRPLPVRAINAYVGALHRAAAHDPRLALAFLEVANLMRSPAGLLHPALAWRVLRGRPARRQARDGAAASAGLEAV